MEFQGHRAKATDTSASPDVVALGELLVDFIQVATDGAPGGDGAVVDTGRNGDYAGGEGEGRALYARAAGGAPANVAAALAAQGVRAGFVGKVGDDPLGRYALERLAATGVDVSGTLRDPAYSTTLAFASVDPESGGLAYSFARRPGADLMLRADELDLGAIRRALVLHVGSLSLVADPARTATLRAIDEARRAGCLVSFDPNMRPHAWESPDDMLAAVELVLGPTDLLKVSRAEMELLTGTSDAAVGARMLLERGPRLVAVTLDEQGAHLATRGGQASSPAYPVTQVADTAGAGDAFWGAALAWLLREGGVRTARDLDGMGSDGLLACARRACAAASLSVERRGALGSAPTAEQTARRLAGWA